MKPFLTFAALGIGAALGLAACASTAERPLPLDHPASPTAPEAPRQPLRHALGRDAESARTRQLLTDAARQNQSPAQEPGQGPAEKQQNMPGMDMSRGQPKTEMPQPGQDHP
jgi:hypothetical protein